MGNKHRNSAWKTRIYHILAWKFGYFKFILYFCSRLDISLMYEASDAMDADSHLYDIRYESSHQAVILQPGGPHLRRSCHHLPANLN